MTATAELNNVRQLDNPLDDGPVFQLIGAEVFAVPSDSKPRIYQVILALDADGKLHGHCTCPAMGPCKHIRRVLAARAGF